MTKQETIKLDEIKHYLDKYTLDPTYLNYGGYTYVSKQSDFHPDYRGEYPNGRLNVSLRFLEASIGMLEDEISYSFYLAVKKEVAKHLQTEKFKQAVLSMFNSFKLKVSYSLTDDAFNERPRIFNSWYGEVPGDNVYPLGALSPDNIREEYKKLDTAAQKMQGIASYKIEIQLLNTHFTNEEFVEFAAKCDDLLPILATPPQTVLHQAIQVDKPIDNFLSYTFNCTGRKIKYDPTSMYSLRYFNVTNFPISATCKNSSR